MPPRPRSPHGGGEDPPNDGGPPPRDHGAFGQGGFGSVARLQEAVGELTRHGRPIAAGGAGPRVAEKPASAPALTPDDIELHRWETHYDDLGDEPPRFNIAANDAAHDEAHTGDHHGPQIPLQHIPGVKTIEGRIYGGHGWAEHKNGSFKWDNFAIMHRTISDYVNEHWELIRTNLAMNGRHRAVFDAGHRVGEGFVNRGMGGAGPRQAQYMTTSVVRILIRVVPGSDPPEPFIVTAFPAGLG